MTEPRSRAPFSAIVDRPPLRLPGGARIAIWTIVNLEVWDIARPMARQVLPPPTGASLLPDVANWSWHEYGMRVGVYRAAPREPLTAPLPLNAGFRHPTPHNREKSPCAPPAATS